ncbi:trypsin-4-like [Arctopsyche grandis]|uniref:trypsin-4-like n=1 Tax=Arctopsyche grandis TaxID=121162 RepID=UPI00406D8FE7
MADSRIVGGFEGNIIETPYLLYDEFVTGSFRHICGGAIINNRIILTAANCTDGRVHRPESYRVRAGSNSHNSGGVISVVSKIIPHEYYEIGGNHENDISLVFLSTALTMGNGIGIINLPSPFTEPAPGSNAVVTGWGTNVSQISY